MALCDGRAGGIRMVIPSACDLQRKTPLVVNPHGRPGVTWVTSRGVLSVDRVGLPVIGRTQTAIGEVADGR